MDIFHPFKRSSDGVSTTVLFNMVCLHQCPMEYQGHREEKQRWTLQNILRKKWLILVCYFKRQMWEEQFSQTIAKEFTINCVYSEETTTRTWRKSPLFRGCPTTCLFFVFISAWNTLKLRLYSCKVTTFLRSWWLHCQNITKMWPEGSIVQINLILRLVSPRHVRLSARKKSVSNNNT